MAEKNTSLNMEENIASLLCYIGLFVTGIIFFLVEKKSKTVKFHAMQSILTFLPLTIIAIIFGWVGAPKFSHGGYGYYPYSTFGYMTDPGIPALSWLSWILYVVIGLLALILMFKAYQGEKFKLPVIGDIAEKQANK